MQVFHLFAGTFWLKLTSKSKIVHILPVACLECFMFITKSFIVNAGKFRLKPTSKSKIVHNHVLPVACPECSSTKSC